MTRYQLRILSCERLNRDVFCIRLSYQEIANQGVSFKAGQYLELFLPDGKGAYFSIASSPETTEYLELHIRSMPESELNQALLTHLQHEDSIDVSLAMGQCHLVAEELAAGQAIYFVAGSTGFAQIKSMVEHLLHSGISQPMRLFWGAREADDLYMQDLAKSWSDQNEHFEFFPIISGPETDNLGEEQSLPSLVAKSITDPKNVLLFVCGSPGMVYALVDAVEARGVSEKQIHADVFAYAPRPKPKS